MAYMAVNLVLGKLAELASGEVARLLNVDAEVKSLTETLQLIQSFLRDADQKPRYEQSHSLQELMRQIRNLAFEMDDLVDEYATRLGRASDAGSRKSRLRRIAAFPSRLRTRHRLASRLQDIHARFQDVCNRASQLGIRGSSSFPTSSSPAADTRLARRFELEEDIVGLDEDMKGIKSKLFDITSTARVVISVVGPGGLGKTTLANKIYRSADVKNYFQCKAWVFVSQKFVVKEILGSIVKQVFSFQDERVKGMEELEMKEKLSEHLSNRRYLVVMDDIWEVAAWNAIKAAFPTESTGSRVVLTTRKMNVANVADIPPHELKFWNVEETWNLFCRKAFRTACCPPEFEQFKEDIFKKTKGLPLAIVVLGGLLRGTSQASDWRKKLEYISYEFREGEDQIVRILALSYHDLPHHLKPCFLYFAAFPEDCNISAEKIRQLWIAEGFIQTDRVDLTMEDLAEVYLKDLTDRSMLQMERKGSFYAQGVRIHDLLLDLARHEARELNFYRSIDDIGDDPRDLRRLSVTENVNDHISSNCSTPKLRSLVIYPNEGFQRTLAVTIPGAKFLRVLDLQKLPIEHLPKEIGDLILLRYLNLSHSILKELPSSIGNLIHLQTFDIQFTEIQRLPDAFWKIRTLRHVFLNMENRSMPKATYCSEDIQTLTNISSGPWLCDGALEKLRNLRRLRLNNISSSDEDALANAVQNLFRLEMLTLFGESFPVSVLTSSCYHHIQLLYLWGPLVRSARIHIEAGKSRIFSNLIDLSIWETRLEKDEDIAIIASLANLQSLKLYIDAFVGRVLVFPKGGFPSLREVLLFRLTTLEQWEVGEGAMPFLRELRLWNCIYMRMLPQELVRLTELNKIEIRGMEMIERRIDKDTGEDYHKIKHVPCIEIS